MPIAYCESETENCDDSLSFFVLFYSSLSEPRINFTTHYCGEVSNFKAFCKYSIADL